MRGVSPNADSPRPRLKPVSVRTRILLWYAILVALALVISVALTHQLLQTYLDQRSDNELTSEMTKLDSIIQSRVDPQTGQPLRSVADALRATLARGLPEPEAGAVAFVDGKIVGKTQGPIWMRRLAADQTPIWANVTSRRYGVVGTEAGPARFLAEPVTLTGLPGRGVFVVTLLTSRDSTVVSEVTHLGIETGAGAIILASIITWLVAGRLLRPVRRVTELARTISETDLSNRIPVSGADEISVLAGTFNDMLGRLEQAFAAQRSFVQDASHELRTPITIVRGQLEVMGEGPEDRHETMEIVFDELDRMDRMVRDLLTLASLARPQPLFLAPVQLSTLVEEVFTKATALGQRSWRLESHVDGTVAILDRQRITQAVLQLATNAVQHTEIDDTIVMKATVSSKQVRFSVQDSGPGVAWDLQSHVFERFARGGNRQARSEGAGLGLAIVWAIAEAHGGEAGLESTPGHGASFSLTIPLRPRLDVIRPERVGR